MLGKKADGDSSLPAQSEEEGAATDLAEADDRGQRMNRELKLRLMFYADRDRFAVA
jgi:hypothetical protein